MAKPFYDLPALSTEQHRTVKQQAALWGMNPRSVQRLFCNHPGVRRLGKRGVMLIPESVAQEVYCTLLNKRDRPVTPKRPGKAGPAQRKQSKDDRAA